MVRSDVAISPRSSGGALVDGTGAVPDQVAEAAVVQEDTQAHAAAVAWRAVGAGGRPHEIRILKERSKGLRKSAVYWLAGAGPQRQHIIAKLVQRAIALHEAHVYRRVLAPLRIATPQLHGIVEHDERFTWLFLDDVQGEPYDPLTDAHRRAAGRWLATLHLAAVGPTDPVLPDRGLESSIVSLRTGARAIDRIGGQPELSADEHASLLRARRALQVAEDRWPEIQALGAPLPITVVHGDFVRKNLRVVGSPGEASLVAFDWERSGRGSAALDLAQLEESQRFSANPCLEAYSRHLRAGGLDVPVPVVERAATVGTILRCLAGIEWTATSMSPQWLHDPTVDLDVYGVWLERSLRHLGLLPRSDEDD
jgi:hypothetical protein